MTQARLAGQTLPEQVAESDQRQSGEASCATADLIRTAGSASTVTAAVRILLSRGHPSMPLPEIATGVPSRATLSRDRPFGDNADGVILAGIFDPRTVILCDLPNGRGTPLYRRASFWPGSDTH